MELFRPPGELKFSSGNLKENWRMWKQQLENYMLATEKDTRPDKTKIAIVLNLLGADGLELYNTFKFETDEEGQKYDTVLKKFEEYCQPKTNIVFERYKFFSCVQKEGQNIDSYVTELKTLASTCEFKDQESSLIRDRIVIGIRDSGLKERLLREPVLCINKASEIVRAAETTKEQLRTMKETAAATVYQVKPKSAKIPKQQSVVKDYDCKKCGKRHRPRECPAFGKLCARCKQKNHFAVGCTQRPKKVHQLQKCAESDDLYESVDCAKSDYLYVESVEKTVNSVSGNSWNKSIKLYLSDKYINVNFKLDTGANVNIIPESILSNAKVKYHLKETSTTLMSYGNFKLRPKGIMTVNCFTEKLSNVLIDFYVVDVTSDPILGLHACTQLKLIQRVNAITSSMCKNQVIAEFKEVFSGTGEFPDDPYKIILKDNAVPVIHPPRRVPQALQAKLKETLDKLELEGIVSKVNKPTDWVQSLVIVEKPNGSLRLCLDPRDLNKVIKREHYQIPSAEDIISRLVGKKVFSVMDLKNGFWHVPLDEDSSEICTFNTPFGRYKFNKLPFGISSAPEVFQKRNIKLFGDIKGVEIYFDDIIVAGSDEAEHDAVMSKVLERAKSLNIKFNPEKFQFKMPEVKYMGQIISNVGIKADPNHVKAIVNMPIPKCKTGVRRLLGMINFLSKFIPNVSQITAPLREIIKDNIEFQWGTQQEESFNQIKSILSKFPVLKVFNGSDEIVIQCDSSKDGLGTCLLQQGQPVSYSSRSLTSSEKNYAQIEKEMLAIVFSFEKYHNLVYGHRVVIQSDHRPLLSIVKKPMHKISPRLQRMVLKLIKYDFEITYIPGNKMFLADTLSRAFLSDELVKESSDMLDVVHSVSKYLPVSEARKAQFKKETESDPNLQVVLNYIKKGWPKSYKHVNHEVKAYYKIKNDLYDIEGLIFLGEKLVVPYSLRNDMLKLIHESHFGIDKCKRRARELLFWPGMNVDIEKIVSQCEICEKFRRANTKEPLKPHSVPYRPFEKVGVDIMEFGNVNYLVLMDYFSKWLEVKKLNNKSAEIVVENLKEIFSEFGVPNTVVSDNMPFNSQLYKQFAREWDFDYVFTSPYHSQSNGLAEKAVGIAKSIIRKTREENKDYYAGLMEYRNTPISGLDLSPAQMMFSRRLKTKLPVSHKLLNADIFKNVRKKLVKRQDIQKSYYDRGAKSLPELEPGENILIRDLKNKIWEPAKVVAKHKSCPRSYYVQNETGRVVRRNRRHIRKTNKIFKEQTDPNDIIYDNLNDDIIYDDPNDNITIDPPQILTSDNTNTSSARGTRVRRAPGYLNDYIIN